MATLAVLGLLVAAAPASAIVISNGPTTAPGAGWSCSLPVAGSEKLAGGGNYSCAGTASAFSNLYIGINRLTTLPFGLKMNSVGTEPSGTEMFIWSTDTATTIRYTGQTAMINGGPGTVFTRVTLTFSGAGTVVSDATTQALTGANIRGLTGNGTAQGVHSLWRVGSGVASFSVNVLIEAATAIGGPFSPANTFFGTTASPPTGHRLYGEQPVARRPCILHVHLRRFPNRYREWD